jgi:hypothetical protein
MMQLIVLGQIPGTHFQLTYGWFQLIMVPLVIFGGYKLYRWHTEKQTQQTQRHFDFISLRSLDQA